MNEVNELINQLKIGELTIEQFLSKLELNPIKIKPDKKIKIINTIKQQIIISNNNTNNIYIIEHQKYFGLKDVLIIHKTNNYELTITHYTITIY